MCVCDIIIMQKRIAKRRIAIFSKRRKRAQRREDPRPRETPAEKLSPMSRAPVVKYKLTTKAEGQRHAQAARPRSLRQATIPPTAPRRHEAECLKARSTHRAERRPRAVVAYQAPKGAFLLFGPGKRRCLSFLKTTRRHNPVGSFPLWGRGAGHAAPAAHRPEAEPPQEPA